MLAYRRSERVGVYGLTDSCFGTNGRFRCMLPATSVLAVEERYVGTSNNSYRAVGLLVFGVGCLLVVPTVLDVWMAPPEVLPEPPSFVEPLGGVLTAVLGIVITVVAIVVQLAAQRYTPKVVDLFMRDRTTLGTFGFMVVSCIYVVMAPMFTRPEHPLSVPVVLCTPRFRFLAW